MAADGLANYIALHVFNRSFDRPTNGFLMGKLLYSYVAAALAGFVADIAHRRGLLYAATRLCRCYCLDF